MITRTLKDQDLVDRLGRFDPAKAQKLLDKTSKKDLPTLLRAFFDLGWSVGRRTTTSDDWCNF